jgi:uncharacterized protein (DUF1697 family)
MTTYVALLYSVIIDASTRVVMSNLRGIAESVGCRNASTLASTGNLVFDNDTTTATEVATALEAAFAAFHGKHVDIIVKTATEWQAIVNANPYPAEAEIEPDRVHIRVMRMPAREDLLDFLEPYRRIGERVSVVDGHVWLHFAGPLSQSRLPAQLTPKRMGGIGTARNWNTVRRLGELVSARGS